MLQSYEIKRQILEQSDKSSIKTNMNRNPPGISFGEQIEIGNELERTTKTPGWGIIEQFMISRMNLVGYVTSEQTSEVSRGIAKGYIELMQYIDLLIKRKNKIMDDERLKNETKSVQKNEIDQGI